MKKALLNWRYYVLFAIAAVGTVALFGVPADDSKTWFADMLLSKAIAVLAWWAWYKLISKWEAKGVIPEMTQLINEEDI